MVYSARDSIRLTRGGPALYRQKIQDNHTNLSPSYRKVADFVMTHYYEVAFMTAAHLAAAVGVDTTTIVRFSQRLGFGGYPDLLQDIRAQVKEELYAVYEPALLDGNDPATLFKALIDQSVTHLRQILVHNPPAHLQTIARRIGAARRILLVAEGEMRPIAQMAADRLQLHGLRAETLSPDPRQQAIGLAGLAPQDVVIGINGGEGDETGASLSKPLAFARGQGCRILGVVGKLEGGVNRWADEILYVPFDAENSASGAVALSGALMALAQAVVSLAENNDQLSRPEAVEAAYRFITGPSSLGE